ncbi:MAG: hypothetical protein WCK32_06125 [Chlorobiaceae bacterium]
MITVLVGESGFVGSTLKKQTSFDFLYRSVNIGSIDYNSFDKLVCAAAPAQKWIANQSPQVDLQNIKYLIEHIKSITCGYFILISTVDVFKDSKGVDEGSLVTEYGLSPYGLHRRILEKFVEDHFPNHLIVRLPGLVGPGLRKNIIYDFHNNNNLHAIDCRGVFQFYPMVNLWHDIDIALKSGLKLVHLTAEPMSVSDVASHCFAREFTQILPDSPAHYDFQSKYAGLFGGQSRYQYSKREATIAIRAYAQSEPLAIKNAKQ